MNPDSDKAALAQRCETPAQAVSNDPAGHDESECAALRVAATELLRLKTLKDDHESWDGESREWDSREAMEDYYDHKDAAWDALRAALAQ